MNSFPHAIIFDLDNTLLDRDTSVRRLLTQQWLQFFPEHNCVLKDAFIEKFLREDNNGYSNKVETYTRVLRHFEGLTAEPEFLAEHFRGEISNCVVCFESVKDVLCKLSDTYKLGMITNGTSDIQRSKINTLGLESYFDSILIGGEGVAAKPSGEIFEKSLEQLGVKASQAIMVGDHDVNDIQAASNCGIKTVWIRNKYYAQPECCDYVISNVSELFSILDR
ncbi:HAD family hydrolase [Rubellicoccus peritrichatus]|uniref:HAD family hydrolase n=1 Tax=Rubellicoccus peritrichatus TaxID=3080537 RepID=A0AAQ3L4S8_9BACT|nr:HAD family hydrolase [Puniceicoccus sp. CR14]WOO39359.1 HAD family hydrolase [Puniceicoccus sp. CR14]